MALAPALLPPFVVSVGSSCIRSRRPPSILSTPASAGEQAPPPVGVASDGKRVLTPIRGHGVVGLRRAPVQWPPFSLLSHRTVDGFSIGASVLADDFFLRHKGYRLWCTLGPLDRYESRSSTLWRAGPRLSRLGLDPPAQAPPRARLRQRGSARGFVELLLDEVGTSAATRTSAAQSG